MTTFQTRMRLELTELGEKLEKLIGFLNSPVYDTLPDVERLLLLAQSRAMSTYYWLLEERIERL